MSDNSSDERKEVTTNQITSVTYDAIRHLLIYSEIVSDSSIRVEHLQERISQQLNREEIEELITNLRTVLTAANQSRGRGRVRVDQAGYGRPASIKRFFTYLETAHPGVEFVDQVTPEMVNTVGRLTFRDTTREAVRELIRELTGNEHFARDNYGKQNEQSTP